MACVALTVSRDTCAASVSTEAGMAGMKPAAMCVEDASSQSNPDGPVGPITGVDTAMMPRELLGNPWDTTREGIVQVSQRSADKPRVLSNGAVAFTAWQKADFS